MLELQTFPTDVVGCYGQPEALDRLADGNAFSVRVAPYELLRFGERVRLAELEAELVVVDSDSLVLDLSSAFSIWRLRGDHRFEAFSRLSELQLPDPPGAIQGLVAQVPTKVVAREEELLLLVSSALSHHLRDRVHAACADLVPAQVTVTPAEESAAEEVLA